MKTLIALSIVVIALAGCGEKEKPRVSNPTPSFITSERRAVFVDEYVTKTGVECVVVTMYKYGPAVSCNWK